MDGRHAIHLSRRRVLFMGAAAFALPFMGVPIPSRARTAIPQDIDFRALYQGAPVGEHRVTFRRQGDTLVVSTHIDIEIKVWFLTAFRYAHDAVEVWQSGRLVSVDSTTDDDGVLSSVSGRAVHQGFRISAADGPFLAPPSLLTTNTLWDRRLMRETTVIDVQHGGVTGLVVKPRGSDWVETPHGAVNAARYQVITPHYAGSLFFDDAGRWVKGLIEKKGELLEYILNA